jgi:hypothetical protein
MATLSGTISAQVIVDRFADYVQATANSGIVWGTDALPTSGSDTVVPSGAFGGGTGGRGIGVNGSSINTNPINGNTIYTTLLSETNAFTSIRQLRAILNVTGAGGNNGSRPTAGFVYDSTNKAYMSTGYLQTVTDPGASGVSTNNLISAGNLQALFDNLRTAYNNVTGNTVTYQTDVCHASCHSSCHSSRGRR